MDRRVESEAVEVLTRGRKFEKLGKAGIDRLFSPSINKEEMCSILSQKLRDRTLGMRDFVALTNYYMELKHWHAPSRRSNVRPSANIRKKSGRWEKEPREGTELHDMVRQLEGAN